MALNLRNVASTTVPHDGHFMAAGSSRTGTIFSMLPFLLGIILCGLKFPFNWLFPDAKFEDIQKTGKFGLWRGPRLQDAWLRIETPGRTSHDLTNLCIEWVREWLPLSVKFLCGLFVWSNIFWLLVVIFL
jgi:hypothetical protein